MIKLKELWEWLWGEGVEPPEEELLAWIEAAYEDLGGES